MKKLFTIFAAAAVVGLLGLLFLSAPTSAQDGPTLTLDPVSVPAEVGDVEVTVSGSGFTDSTANAFVALCPGVDGDLSVAITAANATSACPTLLSVFFTGNAAVSGGSFSETFTFSITQKMVDDGGVVISAGAAGDTSGSQGVTALLVIGEGETEEAQTPTTTTAPPATTTTTTTAAPERETTPAPTPAPRADEDLAETGLETGLLAVIGGSVVLAGLLFAGFSRRIRGRQKP